MQRFLIASIFSVTSFGVVAAPFQPYLPAEDMTPVSVKMPEAKQAKSTVQADNQKEKKEKQNKKRK